MHRVVEPAIVQMLWQWGRTLSLKQRLLTRLAAQTVSLLWGARSSAANSPLLLLKMAACRPSIAARSCAASSTSSGNCSSARSSAVKFISAHISCGCNMPPAAGLGDWHPFVISIITSDKEGVISARTCTCTRHGGESALVAVMPPHPWQQLRIKLPDSVTMSQYPQQPCRQALKPVCPACGGRQWWDTALAV